MSVTKTTIYDRQGILVDDLKNLGADHELVLLARAFVTFLRNLPEKRELSVAVGYDGSKQIVEAFEWFMQGMLYDGVDVYDGGQCVAPALFMSTLYDEFDCDGAVMMVQVKERDEVFLRFYYKGGALDDEQLDEVLDIFRCKSFKTGRGGSITRSDLMGAYTASMRDQFKRLLDQSSLDSLHIVMDTQNGLGSFLADLVFEPLGINLGGSYNLQYDAEAEEDSLEDALRELRKAVVESEGDLGLLISRDMEQVHLIDYLGKEKTRLEKVIPNPAATEGAMVESAILSIADLVSDLEENWPSLEAYKEQLMEDLKNYCRESELFKNAARQDGDLRIYYYDHTGKGSFVLSFNQIKDRLQVQSDSRLSEEVLEELSQFLDQYPSVDISYLN